MNKRFIPIISVLMSISVIIFVTLQIKWLREYYSALNQDFSNKVSTALEHSADQINRIEVNKFWNQQYADLGKSVVNSKEPRMTAIQQVEDSASRKIITYQNSIVEKQDMPITAKGDSLQVTKLWNSEGVLKIRKDPNAVQPLTPELNTSINSGEYALKEFARIIGSSRSIEKRVDGATLNKVLEQALAENGVKTDFGYGIFDKNGKLTKMSSAAFTQAEPGEYSYPLFRDGDNKTLYTLALSFPNRDFSIIRSYYPMLLGTFISLLTILGIYIISINYMMRQKKIADIKTDFINNMSHEFKTPLATISVATDSLANDKIATNPEKVKYYSHLIKQENLRMKKQVENVLNMSKLERNEIQLFLKETNVRELIQDISESFQLIVKERSGTLTHNFKAEKYIFKIDEFHISNILVNLLDNANKYSPEAPQIGITTRNEGNWYVIEISDKGIGMDVQNKTRIFEKFFREETGNIHNVKGQGLGLTYVKRIVELHHGKIDVETQKGKGSTFTLKLPMNA